jgi:hypothetical protein
MHSIDICGKECGKIKMSMEMSMETSHRHLYFPTCGKIKMSMETFHRHLWEGMWENKNVCGNVNENFP